MLLERKALHSMNMGASEWRRVDAMDRWVLEMSDALCDFGENREMR